MQFVQTFYWDSMKSESTKKSMDAINAFIKEDFYVAHLSVGALGSSWAFATVVFESIDNEDTTSQAAPVVKKNIMEQIEDTWGKTNR